MTKVYIETAGCPHNFADSEQMLGLLKRSSFDIVQDTDEADVIIFNTCTVKNPTENAFFRRLNEVRESNPYKIIIVAGCIAQTEHKSLKSFPLIGTNQVHHVVEVVEEALHGNKLKLLGTKEMPPLCLPKERRNPIVEIIPVSRGCLGACAYCKTKEARGNLVSYSIDDIEEALEKALEQGIREVWLTSEDIGCYGFDINTNLPRLLKRLVKVKGKFKIRIGMMNPNHLLKIKDELLPLFESQKLFQFLHVPVQSGNDEILTKMNRGYTSKDYVNLISEIKELYPQMTIATDIIVGFPGETEEQHWDTLNILRNTTPDIVNISRFWARPNTPAEEMDQQIPGEVIKQRSRVLTDICHNIFKLQNERWMGWEGPVIIDEKNEVTGQWIARNNSYKLVILDGKFKMGQILKVKIIRAETFGLWGKIIS